jgi:hypothetical protein
MTTYYELGQRYKQQWGRQILGNRDPKTVNGRKGLVVIYLHDRSKVSFPYVEVNRLTVNLLHEDELCGLGFTTRKHCPLRFCGYLAKTTPHGIRWGGSENAIFFKDLMLSPEYFANGQRMELSDKQSVELALEMDRCLARAASDPSLCRPAIELPPLWAGFRQITVNSIRVDGREFELARCRTRVGADTLIQSTVRDFHGLKLYPLEWVRHELELATTVFAETPGFRRPYVCRIDTIPDDLTGFSGATTFDFYHSQFRRIPASMRKEVHVLPLVVESTAPTASCKQMSRC